MASFQKIKNKKGKSWKAVIRLKGYPTICKSFDRKEVAEDWATEVESQIKKGQFHFDLHNAQHTFNDLAERFINDGLLENHKSSKDTLRHLSYWKDRLGIYGLFHITPEMIGKERQLLINTLIEKYSKKVKRSPATVNRYLSSLSTVFTYAKKLKWIVENPCFSLCKLRESSGRDRILSDQEIANLLQTCKESSCGYLYCIVLIALTTGARKGEILSLKWTDIDFENKVAYLRQTKNNHPRSIPLVEPVLNVEPG